MNARTLPALACIAVLITGGLYLGWQQFATPQPRDITLRFVANVGGAPLEFDKFIYRNPGGGQPFKIHKFRFYLTNFVLEGAGESYLEPESYHLARFDSADNSYEVILRDVSLATIERITFSIGPDAAANGSIATVGDLDPNSQMAWNWKVGYKFLVMEGGLDTGDRIEPLVYHVGFNQNRRNLTFLPQQTRTKYSFDVDAMKLLDGPTQVDIATLSAVKFDPQDAAMLAGNYATMISLRP